MESIKKVGCNERWKDTDAGHKRERQRNIEPKKEKLQMTKIDQVQSKKLYNLWKEGNLSKAEVAEMYGTSENVVKYHIKKHQAQSQPVSQVSEVPAPTAIIGAEGDSPTNSIKEILKGLMGKENKNKIIKQLAATIDQLNTRVEELSAMAWDNKAPTEPKPKIGGKRYVCKAEELSMINPAVILHKDQMLRITEDTEEVIRAVSDGKLVPEYIPPESEKEINRVKAGFCAYNTEKGL